MQISFENVKITTSHNRYTFFVFVFKLISSLSLQRQTVEEYQIKPRFLVIRITIIL